MAYVKVRHKSTNTLWFELDPERALIRIAKRGIMETIDLSEYGLVYLQKSKLFDSEQARMKEN